MPEWNVEDIEGELRVTHWHDDDKRHPATVSTEAIGPRRAECDDCHESTMINRATEAKLIADDSADALAYEPTTDRSRGQ